MIVAFKKLLEEHDRVSIITHTNPDADTLGTALGIYAILKREEKQVEVCTAEGILPNTLDFLPHFAKIKRQIDFDDSLIIACDAGSIDLLGFDLSSREIVNIDHHRSNTNYGSLNIIDIVCASASQVAYNFFKDDFKITKEVATCFYVGLVTDTQNFVTLNVDRDVFNIASELVSFGIDLEEVNRNLNQRKSLSSLRILSATLESLEFYEEARVSSMVVSYENMQKTGADYTDLLGIIDYGIALATVNIAILVMEFKDSIKVSLRSNRADVATLAADFGGGGHIFASGFRTEKMDVEILLNKINKEIIKRGLLDGV